MYTELGVSFTVVISAEKVTGRVTVPRHQRVFISVLSGGLYHFRLVCFDLPLQSLSLPLKGTKEWEQICSITFQVSI